MSKNFVVHRDSNSPNNNIKNRRSTDFSSIYRSRNSLGQYASMHNIGTFSASNSDCSEIKKRISFFENLISENTEATERVSYRRSTSRQFSTTLSFKKIYDSVVTANPSGPKPPVIVEDESLKKEEEEEQPPSEIKTNQTENEREGALIYAPASYCSEKTESSDYERWDVSDDETITLTESSDNGTIYTCTLTDVSLSDSQITPNEPIEPIANQNEHEEAKRNTSTESEEDIYDNAMGSTVTESRTSIETTSDWGSDINSEVKIEQEESISEDAEEDIEEEEDYIEIREPKNITNLVKQKTLENLNFRDSAHVYTEPLPTDVESTVPEIFYMDNDVTLIHIPIPDELKTEFARHTYIVDDKEHNYDTDSTFDSIQGDSRDDVSEENDACLSSEYMNTELSVDNLQQMNLAVYSQNPGMRELGEILANLLDAEKRYILSIEYIVLNYIPDLPIALKGKPEYIFGNMEKLYQFHKYTFCPALETCCLDCEEIGNVFIKYKDDLFMYVQYCMNGPRSTELLIKYTEFFEEKQYKIGDIPGLATHLVLPFQRLIEYTKFLRNVCISLEAMELNNDDTGDLNVKSTLVTYKKAENILQELKLASANAPIIPFIENCPENLDNARLLLTGKLFVNNKRVKSQVMLFDKMIMITEPYRQNNVEHYTYTDHILTSLMRTPVKVFESTTDFIVENYKQASHQIRIRATLGEERDKWCDKIVEVLQQQFDEIKETIGRGRSEMRNSNIPEIQECYINLNEQGGVVKNGKLTIRKNDSIYIGQVVVFKKIMIITRVVNNPFSSILVYDDSIEIAHMYLDDSRSLPETQFCVACNSTNKNFILQAKSTEEKDIWISTLSGILSSAQKKDITQ